MIIAMGILLVQQMFASDFGVLKGKISSDFFLISAFVVYSSSALADTIKIRKAEMTMELSGKKTISPCFTRNKENGVCFHFQIGGYYYSFWNHSNLKLQQNTKGHY